MRQAQCYIRLAESEETARVPLEDISAVVLDHPQINLSQPLLCQLAAHGIAVLVVDEQHLPSGIFLPYLSYHRCLKRLRAQLALSRPTRKHWHRQIVRQKILN